MKKTNKTEIAIWMAAVLPLIITAVLYARLPDRIPMHWNIAGEIDGYGARMQAFIIPAMSLGTSVLMKLSPRFDPKSENYKKFGGAFDAFRLTLALFFLVMTGVTLYAAFDPEGLPVSNIIIACVGGLFCVIGNFMPKFKHNYFIGIRTPWTLASEEVWHATHRMAGPVWCVAGLVMLATAFLPFAAVQAWVVLGAAAICALVPMVYSYILYKRA